MPGCRGAPVAKRQTKRKVTIVLLPRVPDDPRDLLQAIEETFRPGEIEVRVESPGGSKPCSVLPRRAARDPAREHAAEVLDERDRRAREAPAEAVTADRVDSKVTRGGAPGWLRKVAAGCRIFVRVLPVAKKVAEIAKDISEAAGF